MQALGHIIDDDRTADWQRESTGHGPLVAVDAQLAVVDERVAGVVNLLRGQHVLDAQQIQQRRIQRPRLVGPKRGNAVKVELILL